MLFFLIISTQRSKQTLAHHFQQHHPGMVAINNPVSSMGHMMEMMPQRHQAPPLQHHHHPHHHPHHPQLPAPPLSYQRCHAPPPQHLGSSHSHQLHQSGNVPHTQAHQSPPSHLHQASPPAPPLPVPAQVHSFTFTDCGAFLKPNFQAPNQYKNNV